MKSLTLLTLPLWIIDITAGGLDISLRDPSCEGCYGQGEDPASLESRTSFAQVQRRLHASSTLLVYRPS